MAGSGPADVSLDMAGTSGCPAHHLPISRASRGEANLPRDGPTAPARSMGRVAAVPGKQPPNKSIGDGYLMAVAARTIAGWAIPGVVVFFFWMVVAILIIIVLAFIVHAAGGGVLNLRLGHFVLQVGFT